MPFDPKTLPPSVQAEFRKGPIAWPLVLERALDATIFNINKLTDIIFYLHHPERIGRPLQSYETTLINEWKGIRTLITPRVKARASAFHSLFNGIEGTDVPGF